MALIKRLGKGLSVWERIFKAMRSYERVSVDSSTVEAKKAFG
ncbi:MAG: hypothetical protein QW265_04645 [Candidatus Bathyarchaeia archaeon]